MPDATPPPAPANAHTQAIPAPQVLAVPLPAPERAVPNEPAVYADQAAYAAAIRSRVRKNLILPRNVPGTAGALVEVVLSDAGAVTALRMLASSGFPAYDAAIRRAIQRGQPYPLLRSPGHHGPMTMRLRFQVKD